MLNVIRRGAGYPLVFLHGAMVDNTMWEGQIQDFAAKYQVLAVDLPGHGLSTDMENHYTVEEMSGVICEELIDTLDGCILCGHSLGGMIAQHIAVLRPAKIKALILAETSYGTRNNTGERIQSLLADFFLALVSAQTVIRASGEQYGKLNETTKEYITNEMGKFDKKHMRKIMGAALDYAGKEFLGRIACKTLILVGSHNKQTHGQAKIMNRVIKNSELKVISNAHHLLNMDNKTEFNKTIEEFIMSTIG